jgi:sugar phosphate isomerase/epimerase
MKTPKLLRAVLPLIVFLLPTLQAKPGYGLQLWSLREQTKTDVPGALDRVREWGVAEVETAGTGGMPVEKFKELLDARGLKPVSMHVGADRLNKELEAVLHEARVLGAAHIVCPWYPHERGKFDAETGRKAAADFNRWGAAVKAAGFRFAYHPHGFEFAATGGANDERVFDVLIAATDPALVSFEMDVFWVYHAGVDPVALLEKYAGRWTMLHLKDLRKGALRGLQPGVTAGSAPPTDKIAVGQGEIDWPAVLRAARKQGVKHLFVEDETLTPLTSIPASLDYLRALKE